LGRLFFDRSATPDLIAEIKSSGMFVIPTLVTLSSAFGNNASTLAADERVSSRLNRQWLELAPGGSTQKLYRTRSQIALFQKVESAICDRGYYKTRVYPKNRS
jgi:hypothetical protein